MVDLWIEISTLAVLIGLSGFFSGLEVALVGVRKSKVVQLFNEGKSQQIIPSFLSSMSITSIYKGKGPKNLLRN